MSIEKVEKYLLILRAVKLATRTQLINDWAIVVENPKHIGRNDKLDIVQVLVNKNIIDENEKISMIEFINRHYDGDYYQGDVPKETKNLNFENSKSKTINPDSGLSLVSYYYDFLSETFGAKYPSRNELAEAKHLKEVMRKNNDSAETTRQFFRWVITRAKQKNQFDKVSSLGLYPEYRKHAHYAIFVKGHGDSKLSPEVNISEAQSDESILKNVQEVFAIYKAKGSSDEEINTKLRSNFSDSAIDKFTREISGNQI